jgi:hypothetical protein
MQHDFNVGIKGFSDAFDFFEKFWAASPSFPPRDGARRERNPDRFLLSPAGSFLALDCLAPDCVWPAWHVTRESRAWLAGPTRDASRRVLSPSAAYGPYKSPPSPSGTRHKLRGPTIPNTRELGGPKEMRARFVLGHFLGMNSAAPTACAP